MSDIHLTVPTFEVEEVLAEIRLCLEKGWTGAGFKTVEFEEAWKQYTGLPHAHFVNSATAGLHLAVRCLKANGWCDSRAHGNEVITTPLTFVSTNHVLLHEGLRPVFADVDDTLCLSRESVAARITERTRAVMFVGMGGNCGELNMIAALCRDRKLKLIVDAAHMAGTRVHGHYSWMRTLPDAIVFSYQAVKNLPTADAGMVCFEDVALDTTARRISWLGIDRDTYARTQSSNGYKWKYDVDEVGWKYAGNSIMAAIALVQLRHLDRDNAYRRQLATWYDQMLPPEIERPRIPNGCESSRHLYQVLVNNRDEVMLKLNSRGIFPGVHYACNTDYSMYSYAKGTCPNAERAASRLISLPLHLRMTHADVARVAYQLVNATRA